MEHSIEQQNKQEEQAERIETKGLTDDVGGEASAVAAAPSGKEMKKASPQVGAHYVFLTIRRNRDDEMGQKCREMKAQILAKR